MNDTQRPAVAKIICYEMTSAKMLELLEFDGGPDDSVLVGLYFEFKEKNRDRTPLDALQVVPVYREKDDLTVKRATGHISELKRLGRILRKHNDSAIDDDAAAGRKQRYRDLEGFRDEIEFVFFGAEELRYLAARSQTLRFSGCLFDAMSIWDAHWDNTDEESSRGPLFTLKLEGLRKSDKGLPIGDGLSAAFFLGAACPRKWYSSPTTSA